MQIRSGLWNSMESKKRSSLVFLPTAQLGLEQVPELYSSVNNFERIYDDLLLPYSILLCKIIIQNLKIYVKDLRKWGNAIFYLFLIIIFVYFIYLMLE